MVSETSAFSVLSSGASAVTLTVSPTLPTRQVRVDLGHGVHFDVHVLLHVSSRTRSFDANFIDADDQVGLAVVAGLVD